VRDNLALADPSYLPDPSDLHPRPVPGPTLVPADPAEMSYREAAADDNARQEGSQAPRPPLPLPLPGHPDLARRSEGGERERAGGPFPFARGEPGETANGKGSGWLPEVGEGGSTGSGSGSTVAITRCERLAHELATGLGHSDAGPSSGSISSTSSGSAGSGLAQNLDLVFGILASHLSDGASTCEFA
jgi:hypothetical protein